MHEFSSLLRQLIAPETREPVSGVPVEEQFRPDETTGEAVPRNLTSAFLLALAGRAHPLHRRAIDYLSGLKNDRRWGKAARFYLEGLSLIPAEVERACAEDREFKNRLSSAAAWLDEPENLSSRMETVERFREVFFPEGAGLCRQRDEKTAELRKKRAVKITRLNPSPIRKPAREVLFTSNVLLTVPLEPSALDAPGLAPGIKDALADVINEEQAYWYDHPIPLGIERERNEALYGLGGLDEAVAFEKQQGSIGPDEKLDCVLSVSVTHRGLQRIAKDYIEHELNHGTGIRHLNVYVFTEADTSRLLEEVLAPAIREYLGPEASERIADVRDVIGVDGEYGRHYTFLKAVSAFWHVFINTDTRATFKIDLDQVFPQDVLLRESGRTALGHLKNPLWGAEGIDQSGRKVELGMLAGALVNQADIGKSLFVPDVPWPSEDVGGDEVVFQSTLPQALSTEAEMMTRYGRGDAPDGRNECIQRIHVTGGTSGILVESLRRHRPFTPVFIGRAEDQAYIMSVLFGTGGASLRYVHCDGLVMRHDKEAFASDAIEAARTGKVIGDHARILWFSYYCRALPWPVEAIKDTIDPFTGCFVSKLPFTVVYLRLALKAAACFAGGTTDGDREGSGLLEQGSARLHEVVRTLSRQPNPLIGEYRREKEVWDIYYDVLDRIEEGLGRGDTFALELFSKARALVGDCIVNIEG